MINFRLKSLLLQASRQYRPFTSSCLRQEAVQTKTQIVSRMRAETGCTISQAMAALKLTTPFKMEEALIWLQKEQAAAGAAKIIKLADREVHQGLIVSSMCGSTKGSIVELNCETDFVASTDEFGLLAADIAYTIAMVHSSAASIEDIDPTSILGAPIISSNPQSVLLPDPTATIGQRIEQATAKLGERIFLRRATCFEHQPADKGLLKSYAHNSPSIQVGGTTKLGKILSLVDVQIATSDEGEKIANAIARQCVAMPTETVHGSWSKQGDPESMSLLSQPFIMLPSSEERSVGFELDRLSKDVFSGDEIRIRGVRRWSVGEKLEKTATSI